MSDSTIHSSPCLQGERVAFTGTLASMTHREACELVTSHGGSPMTSVSGQTTMLVVGDEGWPLESDGRTSQKFEFIESRREQGHEIRVLVESDWLHLLGLADRDELHRAHTPAMLSQLLDVSVRAIRRWERLGLIRAVRRVHRLPYFDFHEVATARRLSKLLHEGVSPDRLEHSLAAIGRALQGASRPLAQLNILVHGSDVVLRDERGIMEATSGQRMFDFDPSATTSDAEGPETEATVPFPQAQQADGRDHWTAEEWFYEGCRLADAMEPAAAVEALRMSLMTLGSARRADMPTEVTPHPAEISFQLADALYRTGQVEAALERYHAAVEHDPHYLEAWIQLGCLHAETGQLDRALDAFRIALDVHPDYPDANLHIANTYEQAGRMAAARQHWARYLEFDNRGPWAEHARQCLERTQPMAN